MSRYAIIESGIVINVIEADAAFAQTVGAVLSETASPGDIYQSGAFTRPEPSQTIPAAVTMRQARLALLGAGVLALANDAIAAMQGVEGEAARIEWEYAHEVRRDAPLVAGMAAVLGLTEAQLDGLFITAAGL